MMRKLAIPLLLASALLHWPGSEADFSYDDRGFVVTNESIRSVSGAVGAFALSFPPREPGRALYRPVTNLSYALDHRLWGDAARGFHATNVALYLLVLLLVHRLARVYVGSEGFALSVALLFSVHPVHCEAVDSISGRSEILSLLFALISLLAFLRAAADVQAPRAKRARLVSAGFYALACLSKETGAVLPAILAVHLAVLHPPPHGAGRAAWMRRLRVLLPHAVVLGVYLLLRAGVLGRFSPEAALLGDAGLWTRLLTMGDVFQVYVRLLLLPVILQVDFYYQVLIGIPNHLNAGSLLGWLLLLALLTLTAMLAHRRLAAWRAGDPEHAGAAHAAALCALAIFFGFLFPYSHVLDLGALAAERFLFAPSLGFVLLLVLAGRSLLARGLHDPARRTVAILLVALLVGAGGWRSVIRAREWRDPVRLWLAAERNLHGDVRIPTNLAAVYIDRGELEPAREALSRALEIEPDYRPALGNLGALQIKQGSLDEAEQTFQGLVGLDPADVQAWHNLGIIEARRGNHAAAVAHYARTIELDPHFAWARRNLAVSQRLATDPAARLDRPDQRSR